MERGGHNSLRPARREEFGDLTRIWKAAVEATHGFVTADEIAGWEPRIASEFLPSCEVTVAPSDGGEPLGFIGVAGGSLEMLFVDPDFHGRGIGRQLVEHVQSERPGLIVEVNEDNPGAVAFYERLGFEITGRSDLDSEGNPHPLLFMKSTR